MALNYDPETSAVFREVRVELARKRRAADRRRAGIAYDMALEARYPYLGLWRGPGDALDLAAERDAEITRLQEMVTRLLTQLAAGPHLPVAATETRAGGDGQQGVFGGAPTSDRASNSPTRPSPPIEKPQRRVLPE